MRSVVNGVKEISRFALKFPLTVESVTHALPFQPSTVKSTTQ
jgi:hypothetical protein